VCHRAADHWPLLLLLLLLLLLVALHSSLPQLETSLALAAAPLLVLKKQ
jgi:hypothetical protein